MSCRAPMIASDHRRRSAIWRFKGGKQKAASALAEDCAVLRGHIQDLYSDIFSTRTVPTQAACVTQFKQDTLRVALR
jgi:hypothetical protein